MRNVAFLVLAAACWGTGTVVSKQAVAEIAPLTLLPIQLAASVAFLLVLTRARGDRSPRRARGPAARRLGLLNPGLAYALSLIGLAEITASTSVLLWATEPLFILAFAAVVLGERVGVAILAPSAIAIVGLGLVVLDPAAGGSTFGIVLTVAGVVVCAVYTVATRKWLLGSDSTFGVVLAQQLYALGFAVVVVVGLAATGRQMLPAEVSTAGLVERGGLGPPVLRVRVLVLHLGAAERPGVDRRGVLLPDPGVRGRRRLAHRRAARAAPVGRGDPRRRLPSRRSRCASHGPRMRSRVSRRARMPRRRWP